MKEDHPLRKMTLTRLAQLFLPHACVFSLLAVLSACDHWLAQYQQQLRNQITKMFADIEIKKKEIEEQEERDRYKTNTHTMHIRPHTHTRAHIHTHIHTHACAPQCTSHYRKRQREEEEELAEKAKREKEWKTQWDVSGRVCFMHVY